MLLSQLGLEPGATPQRLQPAAVHCHATIILTSVALHFIQLMTREDFNLQAKHKQILKINMKTNHSIARRLCEHTNG